MVGVESATITVLVLGEEGFEVYGTFGEGRDLRRRRLRGSRLILTWCLG